MNSNAEKSLDRLIDNIDGFYSVDGSITEDERNKSLKEFFKNYESTYGNLIEKKFNDLSICFEPLRTVSDSMQELMEKQKSIKTVNIIEKSLIDMVDTMYLLLYKSAFEHYSTAIDALKTLIDLDESIRSWNSIPTRLVTSSIVFVLSIFLGILGFYPEISFIAGGLSLFVVFIDYFYLSPKKWNHLKAIFSQIKTSGREKLKALDVEIQKLENLVLINKEITSFRSSSIFNDIYDKIINNEDVSTKDLQLFQKEVERLLSEVKING